MFTWIKFKKRNSLAQAQIIWQTVLALLVVVVIYLVWEHGMVFFLGIPLQVILATIITPLVLVPVIFHMARKLDEHRWQDNDEK